MSDGQNVKHWTDKPNPEFERWWAAKVAAGYQYGFEALENVRFGFKGAQIICREEYERLRNIVRSSTGTLSAMADQLDRWAQESRTGGWSTHQVDPMIRKANDLRRQAAQFRLAVKEKEIK